MSEVDEFLSAVLPVIREMDKAFVNGDAGQRMRVWSHNDPVTLFGALFTKSGWSEVSQTFEFLASRFSQGQSYEYEVLAAGASGDLGYIVGPEHTTASIGGAEPESFTLRVTTIFRREDGEWKIVHRHADPAPDSDSAQRQLDRF